MSTSKSTLPDATMRYFKTSATSLNGSMRLIQQSGHTRVGGRAVYFSWCMSHRALHRSHVSSHSALALLLKLPPVLLPPRPTPPLDLERPLPADSADPHALLVLGDAPFVACGSGCDCAAARCLPRGLPFADRAGEGTTSAAAAAGSGGAARPPFLVPTVSTSLSTSSLFLPVALTPCSLQRAFSSSTRRVPSCFCGSISAYDQQQCLLKDTNSLHARPSAWTYYVLSSIRRPPSP
mmetsp:Transcript_26374/g.61434  ORF Transcript_26374/g.61434 Transcript_26374/m.61434 type:complete len:236 (-) Transcript_26374:37-744(-)